METTTRSTGPGTLLVTVLGHTDSGKSTVMDRLCDRSTEWKSPHTRAALLDGDVGNESEARVALMDEGPMDGLDSGHQFSLDSTSGALVILDATSTESVADDRFFRQCQRRRLPTCIFVNKWDATAWGACELIRFIRETHSIEAVPVNWPVMESGRIHGLLGVRSGTMRGVGPPPRQHSVAQALDAMHSVCDLSTCNPAIDISDSHPVPLLFGSALHRFGLDDLRRTIHQLLVDQAQ